MIESIQKFFTTTFSNPYIAGILIAIIPIVELRGAIPYLVWRLGGINFLNVFKGFICSFIGSSLVVPVLLLLLIPILAWLKKTKLFNKLAVWIENHFNKKSQKFNEKSENKASLISDEQSKKKQRKKELIKYWGLCLFTAIPLPMTGVWSASAIAAFLKLDFKKSLFFIVLGNFCAGIIVSAVTLLFGVSF